MASVDSVIFLYTSMKIVYDNQTVYIRNKDVFTVGQYLVKAVLDSPVLELGFVWNRTYENLLGHVDDKLILRDLANFTER